MFCGMVDGTARDADQAADGGIVHNSAAFLLAHLEQLILHTEPHTPEMRSACTPSHLANRIYHASQRLSSYLRAEPNRGML